MNIGQCDFDMFEVTVAKLYNAYTTEYRSGMIESLCTDQPSRIQVQEAWSTYRKALVYSPVIDHPALHQVARDQLAALAAIKRAELKVAFSYDCMNEIFREIAGDILLQYGVSDKALETIRILHSVLVGPEEYLRVHKHYPVNEQAFCLAYSQDADAAMHRLH